MAPHYTLRADIGDVMVLIGDGNSEIGAFVRSIWLYDLFKGFDYIKSSHIADLFFLQKDLFSSCVRNII